MQNLDLIKKAVDDLMKETELREPDELDKCLFEISAYLEQEENNGQDG